MIQLHGWATIRENFTIDDENKNLNIIESKIRSRINEFKWLDDKTLGFLNFGFLNGELTLNVSVRANRYRQECKDIFDLFAFIAQIAIGSYGLIYYHDDDFFDEKANNFQVFMMKRGEIESTKDSLLSPLKPVVED